MSRTARFLQSRSIHRACLRRAAQSGGTHHAPGIGRARFAAVLDHVVAGAVQRQHRRQSARLSATRPRPGLPRVLRAAGQLELLLLRRHVLGLRKRQLVREHLVQRPVGARRPRLRAVVRAARSRSLLPACARRTSAAGAPMRPRGGAIIGATRGTATIATGTDGTAARRPRRRRCPCISASIRATVIRVPSSR